MSCVTLHKNVLPSTISCHVNRSCHITCHVPSASSAMLASLLCQHWLLTIVHYAIDRQPPSLVITPPLHVHRSATASSLLAIVPLLLTTVGYLLLSFTGHSNHQFSLGIALSHFVFHVDSSFETLFFHLRLRRYTYCQSMLKHHYAPIIQGHFKAFLHESKFMSFQTQEFLIGGVRDILVNKAQI